MNDVTSMIGLFVAGVVISVIVGCVCSMIRASAYLMLASVTSVLLAFASGTILLFSVFCVAIPMLLTSGILGLIVVVRGESPKQRMTAGASALVALGTLAVVCIVIVAFAAAFSAGST